MTFSKSEYKARLRNARERLGELGGLDALLVTAPENVRYFTGMDSGRVLITKSQARFWLNEVYFGRARDSPLKPIKAGRDVVKKFILSKGLKKVGIDSVTLQEYKSLDPKLRKLLKPSDICEQLRKIKSKEEIKLLSRAGRIAAKAMALVDKTNITGMSEFELGGLLEYEIRKSGSEKPPFGGGLLCLSGRNTSYPHKPMSNRRIRDGDLVVVDLGAIYRGYHSDMTRTFRVGKVPKEEARIADLMDWLKTEAIKMVEVGGRISELHEFIDSKIQKAGYAFVHLSGHGVGLDIHEKPSIGPDEKEVFQEGMVFTIEPGIYTTRFGARSEDTIALVKGKKRILTVF